ncbi:putative porin [Pseudoalteromonas sp. T1lg48]|uniref:putative porin n=1 Tax=Pseudoalteromonas sp. T1lg48 TaxID=2077100 RepID=UPI000CF70A1B|nr:putative porin [Pseudoalteromonas sp. T1lg48]
MKHLSIALASALFSSFAFAQSYQSISTLEYADYDSNFDELLLNSKYYFDSKEVLGPLDQFEYINKATNVYGTVIDNDVFGSYSAGGEYFFDSFMIGASYGYFDYDNGGDSDSNSLSVGYLVNDDLLFKVDRVDYEHLDAIYFFSGQYNHALNATDYIGFTAKFDDEFDYREVSAKYFKDLQHGNYLTVHASFIDFEAGDSYWQLGSSYYFSKATSAFVQFDEEDNYGFGAKHFFTTNFAVEAGYFNNWDDSDADTYYLKATAQF